MNEDTKFVDWLSKNHVSITYYSSPPPGSVEITWFIRRKPKPRCSQCKHQKEIGLYPHFTGKDLREAVKKAMARDPYPEEEIYPS